MHKKINKKAFSMIELLFVMFILGLLMSVAIPALSQNEESAKKIALMNDIKEANKMVVQEYMNNQSYVGAVGVYTDSDNNGIAETTMNGSAVHVTIGNTITISIEDCNSIVGSGYKIIGNLGTLTKEYNSCTSAKLQ